MPLCILEQGEKLWLYQVEDEVLMVEVLPLAEPQGAKTSTIGQVVLKRLITAEQAIDRLCSSKIASETEVPALATSYSG